MAAPWAPSSRVVRSFAARRCAEGSGLIPEPRAQAPTRETVAPDRSPLPRVRRADRAQRRLARDPGPDGAAPIGVGRHPGRTGTLARGAEGPAAAGRAGARPRQAGALAVRGAVG